MRVARGTEGGRSEGEVSGVGVATRPAGPSKVTEGSVAGDADDGVVGVAEGGVPEVEGGAGAAMVGS